MKMNVSKRVMCLLVACVLGFGAAGLVTADPQSEAAVREAAVNGKAVHADTIATLDNALAQPGNTQSMIDSLTAARDATQACHDQCEELVNYPN